MAMSFAAYASQYLNRHQQEDSQLSSSQPMFFSFTTDNESRAGHDTDLDDHDDPHIGESETSRAPQHLREEDDDPYLRLDEDDHAPLSTFGSRQNANQQQRTPLIRSDSASSVSSSPRGGWLAHLVSSPMRGLRSPSPSPSNSTVSDPPQDLFTSPHGQVRGQPSSATTTKQQVSVALTESLLPRDGHTRPLDVFNLPDPRHAPRSRRKYHDSIWTALWLTGVSICVVSTVVLLFLTRKPSKSTRHLPYTTLLHTVPMLTILTILSALAAYIHIFLLRVFVQPVMIATSVFIPATLFISAIWAFVGSFMWDEGQEPTWGETVGLRLFALVPLILSLLTARRLLNLPRNIHIASSTLTLTTHLLINNPFLLALSPAILLVALVGSIPFLTLIFRLLLIGYPIQLSKDSPTWEWHVNKYANWAIAGTVGVWLWSWGVARGILRMSCASVVGAWYFADPHVLPPPPTSTHTIHAALARSTGPSLGTVALSALILTIIQLLTLFTLFLERLPLYIPPRAYFLVNGIRLAVGYLDGITTALSKYALVYAGLTGDPFMPSARRAKALTASVEAQMKHRRTKFSAEPPLALLTVAPLTLSFPFALLTYLFVAHTLDVPEQALGASILAGGVTSLVGLFCVGLVKDAADTLYVCYCIDKDMGEQRREEVFIAFEYESLMSRTRQRQTANRSRPVVLPPQPEEIVPLSPRSPPQRHDQPPGQMQAPAPSSGRQAPLHAQHQRVPSHPESLLPRQQRTSPVFVTPSPKVAGKGKGVVHASPTNQIMSSSRPSMGSVMVPEDDIDPFKQSFAEEDGHHRGPSNSELVPDPTIGLEAPRHRSPTRGRGERKEKGKEVRRMTSAEMNMKSHVFEGRAVPESSDEEEEQISGTVISSGFGRSGLTSRTQDVSRNVEDSELVPGSGFFEA